MKIATLIALLLISSGLHAQMTTRDSLLAARKELLKEIDSLEKVLNGCYGYSRINNPAWTDKRLKPATYYKNCKWKQYYIVLNEDSSFLFVCSGEGINYAEKGIWRTGNDTKENVIILDAVQYASAAFQNYMARLQKKKFSGRPGFSEKMIVRPDMLVEMEHPEK